MLIRHRKDFIIAYQYLEHVYLGRDKKNLKIMKLFFLKQKVNWFLKTKKVFSLV